MPRLLRHSRRQHHRLPWVPYLYDIQEKSASAYAQLQDEVDITSGWQQLAQQHEVELVACIASCLRRGVLDETEAHRYDKPAANVAAGFTIAGLGLLIDGALNADRVITFGA